MNINIGYYPVLDMFLSFRQVYSNERFRPFNKEMSSLEEKLTNDQLEFIDTYGIVTNGYLSAIQELLEMQLGNASTESILVDIISKPESLLVSKLSQINDERILSVVEDKLKGFEKNDKEQVKESILGIWQNIFSSSSAKYTKEIFGKLLNIKNALKSDEVLNYLCNTSDRIYIEDEVLHFNIKPPHEIKVDQIENIIVMPSIYASRDLTFWYSGNNLVFYLALESKKNETFDPSDMLLLNTSALNDRTRLKMLRYMSQENCSASDLANYLDMNASTISRHLKLFKDTGFVDIYSQVGNTIIYSVNRSKVNEALNQIKDYLQLI